MGQPDGSGGGDGDGSGGAVSHGRRHGHRHGVMSGGIVVPYDLIIGGLLMGGVYRRIAAAVTAGLPAGSSVLDVGTGPGRLPAVMARLRPDLMITGVDPSADMLARARRRFADGSSMTFAEAPAESLPLANGSQQAVVSTLSSHHWADLDAALAEQARVLAPGGRWWAFDLRSHVDPGLSPAIERAGMRPAPADVYLGAIASRLLAVFTATASG